jgi:Family of unknown function (DUF5335)
MTHDNEELPRTSWESALQALTKQHEGDLVTIELETRDFGDQHEAEKLPLAYIEYDPHDDAASVGVGGNDGRYPVVLRHVIAHPTRIEVKTSEPEDPAAVEIAGRDRSKTIVTFYSRPALPA